MMNEKMDYRMANLKDRELKLRAQRQTILASSGEKALDMILDAPAPATLIQSFPDQDLYYLMHKIGPYDFIPALALANSSQWEYILDVEVWDNDRLDLKLMTQAFDLLFQADPKRLLRWVIKEKPDFFEFYLFKHMEIVVREHDEVPPEDFDDYITLDDTFYFRFPDKPRGVTIDDDSNPGDNEGAWELIEQMARTVAEMDLSVFHGLFMETMAVQSAEVEEEQFRLRNGRLAEKGFLPTHEAIGIYQPTKMSLLRKRPDQHLLESDAFDPDIPLPPQFFHEFIQEGDLFVSALKLFDSDASLRLESELAALINKVISADRIKLRGRKDIEKAVSKTYAYLNLGLEVLLTGRLKPASAKAAINQYFLEDIFRTGSRAGIQLKTKAVNWFRQSFMNKKSLPLSFLGETYLGVIGGLFLDRPLFFDNYAAGQLYRNFKTIPDITQTSRMLDQIIAIDAVLDKITVDVHTFEQGILTYKTVILTLWAKSRLGLEPTLEPMDTAAFKNFFTALFPGTPPEKTRKIQLDDLMLWTSEATGMTSEEVGKEFKTVLSDLIQELETEYGQVNPGHLDPRFIPHFMLKKKDS